MTLPTRAPTTITKTKTHHGLRVRRKPCSQNGSFVPARRRPSTESAVNRQQSAVHESRHTGRTADCRLLTADWVLVRTRGFLRHRPWADQASDPNTHFLEEVG